jgi:hypothetical protein
MKLGVLCVSAFRAHKLWTLVLATDDKPEQPIHDH